MARVWLNPLAGVRRMACAILLAVVPALPFPTAFADNTVPSSTQDVVRPAGAVVVPEKFLRRWDPITVFFDAETGPANGGAEDHPEQFFSLQPAHPGAATWINARTLQFKPAEPWPPLTRFALQVGPHTANLATLMSAPSATTPSDGATGLDPVKAIALTLPEPLDAEALAKLITIELRPLPGVDGTTARTLTDADFDVKVMERTDRAVAGSVHRQSARSDSWWHARAPAPEAFARERPFGRIPGYFILDRGAVPGDAARLPQGELSDPALGRALWPRGCHQMPCRRPDDHRLVLSRPGADRPDRRAEPDPHLAAGREPQLCDREQRALGLRQIRRRNALSGADRVRAP